MTDPLTAAREALQLAAVEPAAARELAAQVVAQANAQVRARRRWDALCVAERALGVAAMQQSRLDDAVVHLRAAVGAGTRADGRADGRQLTGEARMSLASALMMRGRPSRSFVEIGRALADLDGVAAARALTQRAAIHQELGRLDEALDDLRRALPVLRRAGDAQWETRALSNRGLLHSARREFAAAEADLLAAGRLSREHGLRLPAAIVEHNLAWVASQRGDVPSALRHLGSARALFEELGLALGSLLADQAELLLMVRLVDEARTTAEAAVVADDRDGRRNHLPEARLLLSTIALVQGDADAALAAAQSAASDFARLGRREWLVLARYARIQAMIAADRRVTPAQCRRAADALADAGWQVPALEARLLAGRLALRGGSAADARRDFAQAGRARHSGPADARARAWLGEALLREADGRRRAAVLALRAGLRVVEDYRATLGATELRAHVTLHRGAIARMGVRLAVEDRNARSALWWAECGRATSTLVRAAQPPSDAVLAHLLAELRAAMTAIEERRADQLPTQALVRRQVALERRIRDHCRLYPGSTGQVRIRPPTVPGLRDALGDAALVEYVELDGELHAVTVSRGGVRLHALGPVDRIRDALEFVPFALRRLAAGRARPQSLTAASDVLDRAGALLDDVLLRPLWRHLGDVPLVVVPVGPLQSVPWSLLPSCASRPVSVSPSATLWHAAATRGAPSPGRVVVVAGPRLDGARAEADAVARLHPGARTLVGDDATASNVQAAMDGAALVHVAAHGTVRSDNPLFSALALADGPFTVYDLERLRRAPHHVVLAACDTGRSAVVAGDEILGFTAALMAGGTSTVVASVVPVADSPTVALMTTYHRHLREGTSPAEALARAQSAARTQEPASRAAAAGFVLLGFGDARTPAPAGTGDADASAGEPTRAPEGAPVGAPAGGSAGESAAGSARRPSAEPEPGTLAGELASAWT